MLSIGLVGAGQWAWRGHAPALCADPGIRFAGVWARRPSSAEGLAARFGTTAYASLPELLEACEAVAFAVPPGVQAELGLVAAKAGRPVLLDKPLAADVAGAARLADAIGEAGLPSQLLLTLRYTTAVRAFLTCAAQIAAFGGHAAWVSGGALEGPSATMWRREQGPILDLGPHVIDLMDAALGPVTAVRAHGAGGGWTGILLEHEGGAVSEVSLCHRARLQDPVCWFRVYGRQGAAAVDRPRVGPDAWAALTREFCQTVRDGGGHPLDVRHGLRLQRILEAASSELRRE